MKKWQKKEKQDAKDFGSRQMPRSGGLWYCIPEIYEVLTLDGWKRFGDCKVGNKILSYDLSLKRVVVTPILKLFSYRWPKRNYLVKLSNRFHYIEATINHKFLWRKEGREFLFSYKDLRTKGKLTSYNLASCVSSGNKEYPIKDDEIKLLAWIFTDGSIIQKGGRVGYFIFIWQTKPKMILRIKVILKKLGLEYSFYKRKTKGGFDVGNIAYSFYLRKPLAIIKKYQLDGKNIPNWFYQLSDRQIKIFLEEVIFGDGSDKAIYGNYDFLSQLQGLFITHNIPSTLRKYRGQEFVLLTKKSKNIYLSKEQLVRCAGRVWCLENKYDTMFIRTDNGTCFISGNSKGDSQNERFLIENKTTKYKRFSITEKLWKKLEREAILSQRIPLLSIEFGEDVELIIMDKNDFISLKEVEV